MSRKNLEANSLIELLESVDDDGNQFVELGRRIGPGNLNIVLEVFGSQKPHIPTRDRFWDALRRDKRNRLIRQEFNGRNYAELAKKYSGYCGLGDLGERQVRDIVHGKPKRYKRPQQSMKPIKAQQDVYQAIATCAEQHHVPIHRVLELAWKFLMLRNEQEFKEYMRKKFGEQKSIDLDAAA